MHTILHFSIYDIRCRIIDVRNLVFLDDVDVTDSWSQTELGSFTLRIVTSPRISNVAFLNSPLNFFLKLCFGRSTEDFVECWNLSFDEIFPICDHWCIRFWSWELCQIVIGPFFWIIDVYFHVCFIEVNVLLEFKEMWINSCKFYSDLKLTSLTQSCK